MVVRFAGRIWFKKKKDWTVAVFARNVVMFAVRVWETAKKSKRAGISPLISCSAMRQDRSETNGTERLIVIACVTSATFAFLFLQFG